MTNNKFSNFIGTFVKGSCKNGSVFFGRVLDVDDNFIVVSGKEDVKKYVVISEVTEIQVEAIRGSG